MGACYVEFYSPTRVTQDGYDKAVEVAAWENGHGGYSGTLAEAGGTLININTPTFPTAKEAHEYVVEKAQKWHPAIQVSYYDDEGERRWLLGAWCSS